jgi:error-prone DNA polymerase
MMTGYAELQVTSNYSFLRGGSHVEEYFAQGSAFGLSALAITDHHSLAGIVRAWQAAKAHGVHLVVGCRLDLADGTSLLVYPTDKAAYAHLCRMLTLGKARAGKGQCHLDWEDLAEYGDGLIAVLLPDQPDETARAQLGQLRGIMGDRAYLALTLRRRPGDAVRLHLIAELATAARVPTVATGDVLYHHPKRRILQDVLTCIRHGCTIDELGFRRERFADRHLKPPEEMARLFARHPDAIARSLEIADRCRFDLSELRYQYPNEASAPDLTPQQELEHRVEAGARLRYPDAVPDPVARQLRHELRLISELAYAPYFLTVDSIVRFARSKGILCQGRGSAANSAVCYVLGVTSIDPVRGGLLFERFISAERAEPPDIDVDFEHERREEVIQWVYEHYGREHAALCATVIRYRTKGALRDVGKALGVPEQTIAAISGQIWGWSEDGVDEAQLAELGLDPSDRRLRLTLDLSRELIGFPRHLSQHPGGFVLTEDRLDELVPIEPAAMANRQVIEWDKDDIDALRFMKVDVLGLGMLGCLRRAFDLLAEHREITMDMAAIPPEDAATYTMIRHADTVGTFQIESRAQMSMLPRMKPKTFYDLVIQVAIVRPGPIQGDMVHPYLRRREGTEPVEYPTPELKRVLEKTLGVPLFQEQAMQIAITCAGFTPGEADQLRRSMATFKFTGGVSHFKDKLIEGMTSRGYARDFAERMFRQLEGFGSYGFPESHAASFALIAYASSWIKCHYPEVFCTALLNAQPMGFYAPAQIVRDAKAHGVEVRPVSINHSRWDCTLEPREGRYLAVRLGLRLVKGLANKDAAAIIVARGHHPYAGIEQVWRRVGVPPSALERIADADGFLCLGQDRRSALWVIRALADEPLPLFAAADQDQAPRPEINEPAVQLAAMTEGQAVVEDYRHVGLSLRAHPVSFLRDDLTRMGTMPCSSLANQRDGTKLAVAGLVLVRQRPGSAKGVLFVTIEDESGHANLIIWPSLFEEQRRTVMSAGMLACQGRLQKEGMVIHLVAEQLTDLTGLLGSIGTRHAPADHGEYPAQNGGIGGRKIRDIYVPNLRIEPIIKPEVREFR